jgi:excisionase family DNA binding protein
METKLLHPIPEACDLLSLGRTKLYSEIKAGRICTVKVGCKTLVPHSSLEKYTAKLIAEAAAVR